MPHAPEAESLRYLALLRERFPNAQSASTQMIRYRAILNLPKGTEHFVSDVHGEYATFLHVLRNASGVIKDYIDELFGHELGAREKHRLATLIYYPEQAVERIAQEEINPPACYRAMLYRLVTVLKRVSSKYTRARVREALPDAYAYLIEELLHEDMERLHKSAYYQEIIDGIVALGRAPAFIAAIAGVIHHLAIDRLHVIGDIFDRGPHADKIMDILLDYHAVDIQWGNHDIGWLGAAMGCEALVLNTLRLAARHNTLHTVEDGYGINLVPLATLALQAYGACDCTAFLPADASADSPEAQLTARMHLAATVLQLKAEAVVIRRNPQFAMHDRLLLDCIDYGAGTVRIGGKAYPLTQRAFPTIDPTDPYALTPEEAHTLRRLVAAFQGSAKLQAHARLLLNKGGLYLVCNGNLLYHGCIPMMPDGSFRPVALIPGEPAASGKALLDRMEAVVREGVYARPGTAQRAAALDMLWYLWCGADSPLFGKDKMALFERSFTADTALWHEERDPYYALRDDRDVCGRILRAFGLDPDTSRIINGHVPVRVARGESPVKAGGRLLVIDGGFAKAYHPVTGLAGYTLIYNSRGLILAAHEPYDPQSPTAAIDRELVSHTEPVWLSPQRIPVRDTDLGRVIQRKIDDLSQLLACFESGQLPQD